MEVRLIEKGENKARFLIKDISPARINSLRRAIIEDVPVLAIETVEFVKNDSAMYDEMIAHRLGLLPITTDLKSYSLPEECTCKGAGCSRCQLKLTLKKKGPCTVYASDLKSSDPACKPAFPEMPITKLMNGQELELTATAILGRGKQHAKWSAGHAYYHNRAKVSVKKQPSKDIADRIVKSCPKKIFVMKNGKLEVDKERVMECTLCEQCINIDDKSLALEPLKNEYMFYVESFGMLPLKEMINEALVQLGLMCKEFKEGIKGI